MTAREMQIEFERRVSLMDPTLLADQKLTSDTIFSFLNAYTLRYVKLCYIAAMQTEDGTRSQKRNAEQLKSLIETKKLEVISDTAKLPDDYFMYIKSNSVLSKNYRLEHAITKESNFVITPNKVMHLDNLGEVTNSFYDKNIIINPYVTIMGDSINITCDPYTIVKYIDLTYYRLPKKFNVIGSDSQNVCELPEDVHMEIVEGAVEMFITEAKYRLNTKKE